jgi:hypothetical protein
MAVSEMKQVQNIFTGDEFMPSIHKTDRFLASDNLTV